MSATFIQIIGIIAGSITAVSMLPQLIKIINEKNADNISIWMITILLTGLCFWTLYGYFKNDLTIIITNLFSISINLILIFLKIRFKS